MINITFNGQDYTLDLEDLGLSIHELGNDQAVLAALTRNFEAPIDQGYQVLRKGDTINVTPYAVYG